jgi:hypothetical protein
LWWLFRCAFKCKTRSSWVLKFWKIQRKNIHLRWLSKMFKQHCVRKQISAIIITNDENHEGNEKNCPLQFRVVV